MVSNRSLWSWRLGLALSLGLWSAWATAVDYIVIPTGSLNSMLARDAEPGPVSMAAFAMRETVVTQREFDLFLSNHPQWQRSQVPRTFADEGYLKDRANANPESAVVQVSWFAAQAYCESEQARLPTWYEWEYVAAADAKRRDARDDPAWLARILGW